MLNRPAKLYIIIPCYNEEKALPETLPLFIKELNELIFEEKVSDESKLVLIDDGSTDNTWNIINDMAHESEYILGIAQSRNRGHQNAIWMGLIESKDKADITITIDCDGQDDIRLMGKMIDSYYEGNDIVYAVRDNRDKDSFLKRNTASLYYWLLKKLKIETIPNHADYRLLSNRIINELTKYNETNLFLRGLIPTVGFNSAVVYYRREERISGSSHYSLGKMIKLAADGITGYSNCLPEMFFASGFLLFVLSLIVTIVLIFLKICGSHVENWLLVIFAGGIIFGTQLLCTGIIMIYLSRINLEVKQRPRYIISKRTGKW